jgi:hypothetical protein
MDVHWDVTAKHRQRGEREESRLSLLFCSCRRQSPTDCPHPARVRDELADSKSRTSTCSFCTLLEYIFAGSRGQCLPEGTWSVSCCMHGAHEQYYARNPEN